MLLYQFMSLRRKKNSHGIVKLFLFPVFEIIKNSPRKLAMVTRVAAGGKPSKELAKCESS